MHVLFISTGFPTFYQPLNGIFYLDQAQGLAKQNIQTGFIAIIPTSLKDFVKKGWKNKGNFNENINGVNVLGEVYLQIPKYFSQQFNKTLSSGKKIFESYVSKYGIPDIIHLHGFEGGKLAVWIKKNFKIPFVVTEHSSRFLNNSLSNTHLIFAKEIFSNADHRIAVSSSFAKKLEEFSNLSFQVIPNIVDTDFFNLGNKSISPIFLSAGILNNNKNQILQIESFQKVVELYPNAKLNIVGDGPNKLLLENRIKQLGLKEKVYLLGEMDRNGLRNEMQRATTFLISSNYESFGVVAIEAMSCGLPVISTPCGGPESIIINEKLGFITDGSSSDFCSKMLEALKNSNLFLPEEIRRYAVNNFSESAVTIQLTNVYSQVINR